MAKENMKNSLWENKNNNLSENYVMRKWKRNHVIEVK